ncbi:(2Fe-2S)-binding protein [Alteromonas sp. MTD1]|uniref:(2Fe-2S)-binding protein n=1 Tax=Alteromonas sp. MTD1 TaxID=3057962 RepID=UPI0036F3CBAE
MVAFTLNGKEVRSKAPDDTPLLWVIRDEFGFKGTKFGCGVAMCGACTVHIDDNAVRSCSFPVSMAKGKNVKTIESLGGEHPLQKAWIDVQVPQCGYCQSGQIMQAVTLLDRNKSPSDTDIVNHMSSNYCRCMAHARIKKAIKVAAEYQNSAVQIFDPLKSNEEEES